MDPQWLSPSPQMWRARLTVLAAVTVVAMLGLGLGVGLAASLIAGLGTAGGVVALAAGFAVMLRRRYRSWGYAERADDLLVRRGVMVKRLSIVPYGRMQFVDVTAGPVDRLFKLATVQLHTASAKTDARIPGLEIAEATRLRNQLAALGEAKAAGL